MVCRAHVQKLYVLSMCFVPVWVHGFENICFFHSSRCSCAKTFVLKHFSGLAVQHTIGFVMFLVRTKVEGPMTPRTTWKLDEPSSSPPPTSSRPSLLGTSHLWVLELLLEDSELLGRFSEVSRKIPRHSVKTQIFKTSHTTGSADVSLSDTKNTSRIWKIESIFAGRVSCVLKKL